MTLAEKYPELVTLGNELDVSAKLFHFLRTPFKLIAPEDATREELLKIKNLNEILKKCEIHSVEDLVHMGQASIKTLLGAEIFPCVCSFLEQNDVPWNLKTKD